MQLPEASSVAKEPRDVILGALSRHPLLIQQRTLPPLFNRYGVGHAFGMHVDGAIRAIPGTPIRIRTDPSVTLFLVEPDEYDGGELTVDDKYGTQEVKLPAGDLVLYPATSLHHAKRLRAAPAPHPSSGSRAWCATKALHPCYSTWIRPSSI